MSIGILGRKLGMTHILNEQGNPVPVTVIEAPPCPIVQIKNKQRDGYSALQIAFQKRGKDIKKEVRITSQEENEFQEGHLLKADIFKVGDYVKVIGVSKGKGFQGGVKRWGWRGGPKTHGSMSHRRVGSIGASSDPSRVLKGQHLPGRMGNAKTTIKNLRVMKVDVENNILCIKGGVPGSRNSVLLIKK